MRFPRLTLILLIAALGAWGAGALYTWFVDPEMKFWTAVTRQKLDWVESMRAKHGYVIGVVGGSTTTFGIDAEHIEREHGLPVANLGLHVGMGFEALVGFGLSSLREGDTLILSLEPGILTDEHAEISKLGSKLSLLLGKREMITLNEDIQMLPIFKALAAAPPGGYHVITMLGKLAMREPPYRYSIDNLRPGGLQTTDERRNFTASMDFTNPTESKPISKTGIELLRTVRLAAERKGINVAYALPWSYWPAQKANERRAANKSFLRSLEDHIPILVDPYMGVHTELKDFSDSGQHLTRESAAKRSAVLAETIIDSFHSQ
jgi:hypothetical protein